MLLALVALTSIVAIAIPAIVTAQNMTGNMTGGQNMTADMNQTGSISGIGERSNRELYISDYSPD